MNKGEFMIKDRHMTKTKTLKQAANQSAYVKMLASYTALVAVALVALVVFCYTLFNRSYSSEVQKAQMNAVQYEKNVFTSLVLNRGREMVKTLANESSNVTLLRMPLNGNRQYQLAVYQIHQKLVAFSDVNSDMLDSVTIFYPGQGFCVSSQSGFKLLYQEINYEYARLHSLLIKQSGVRAAWQFLAPGESGLYPEGCLAFTVLPLWTVDAPANAPCVAFFIKPGFLRDMLRGMAVAGQRVYLLDGDGQVVCASDDTPMGQRLESPVLATILATPSGALLSAADWPQNQVFACCALEGTPLKIVIAMDVDSWRGSTGQIRLYVSLAGLGVLALALCMVLLITKKLYSPLRVLRDLVQELTYVDGRNLKNEFTIISTGLGELSRLLSNTQRVLHTNQSLLKNQALLNLIHGQNQPASLETLNYLRVHFPYRYFSLLAVEYCDGDTRHLDANTRQALSVALVDTAENSDANQGVRVYGFIPQANTVCLLVNHPAPAEPKLEILSAMITSYFSCYDTRCYIAQSNEAAGGLSGLDRLYAQAMAVLAGRLYDRRPGPVHLETISGSGPVPDSLLKRLESIAAAGGDAELLRQLDALIAALGQTSPVAAQICLQKALTILRGFMLSRRPGQALPPALLEPAAYLWELSELPALLQEALGAPDTDAPGDDAAFMRAVNAYIAQHMNEDISLEALSEALHFNPKYFSRKFKKVSGTTISSFLTVCRMEAASDLLRKTDLSLEDIAERTGYKTTQYFGRKFKETYGVTPGEYRRAAGR